MVQHKLPNGLCIKQYKDYLDPSKDKLLPLFEDYRSKHTFTEMLFTEKSRVIIIRERLQPIFIAQDLSTVLSSTPNDYIKKMVDDSVIVGAFKELLIYSYWRDDSMFTEFDMYPTVLEPFKWLKPIFQIQYDSDLQSIKSHRIDYASYYFVKYIIKDDSIGLL